MTRGGSTTAPALGEVLTGRIVARFVYASRGTDGWSVSSMVGSAPTQVVDEAIRHLERLNSPEGYALDPDELRDRRLVWAGGPGAPWRFLINSVAAGADASARPNNCFSDCLIVQRDPVADGTDPAAMWGSRDWLTPFGAQEVAAADLRPLGDIALHPAVASDADLSALVRFIAEDGQLPGFLFGVARMIESVHRAARNPSSTWIGVGQLVLAPILLSVLYDLLPYDVGWDVTCEIRKTPRTGATPSLVNLRLVESAALPIEPTAFAVTPDTTIADPEMIKCPMCGKEVSSWSDILVLCLTGLAGMLQVGETKAQAADLADLLGDYCAQLRRDRIPASQYPAMFSDERLPGEYARLTELFGRVHTHDHLLPRRYVPDPEKTMVLLRERAPDDLTHAIAARQLERLREQPVPQQLLSMLDLHIGLGDPPETAQAFLQRLSALRPESQHAIVTGRETVRSAVANRLLRSVAILGCTHYRGQDLPRGVTPKLVLWALNETGSDDWSEPIRSLDLLDKFLQSWVAVQPGQGAVTQLLVQTETDGVSSHPLGYLMTREALKPRDHEEAGYFLKFLEQARRTPWLPEGTSHALQDLEVRVRQAVGDEAMAQPGGWDA